MLLLVSSCQGAERSNVLPTAPGGVASGAGGSFVAGSSGMPAPPSSGGTSSTGGASAARGGSAGATSTGGQGTGANPPQPSSGGAPGGRANVADASIGDSGAPDAADDAGTEVPIPAPAPSGCVTEVGPGPHEFACDTTTHVVMVPERCTRVSCGVIIDVHGGSMSADMEDRNTAMRALGDRHGYLVIQPNALPNPILLGERVFVAGVDDDRVMHILTDVVKVFHADERRIHMMGFSEGGFMTWRFICGHSDLLASAAPAAAGYNCTVLPITQEIGCQFSGTDAPTKNIPILYMQGTEDKLMNPDCVFSWLQGSVYPTLKLDSGSQIAGDATYERTRFLTPDAVPFELIRHHYTTDASSFGVPVGGHCYPGSTDFTASLPGQLMGFGCKDQCSFTWAEEAVRFFMAHPKR
jgi:polyhydroxybutyrate depolymerase